MEPEGWTIKVFSHALKIYFVSRLALEFHLCDTLEKNISQIVLRFQQNITSRMLIPSGRMSNALAGDSVQSSFKTCQEIRKVLKLPTAGWLVLDSGMCIVSRHNQAIDPVGRFKSAALYLFSGS